MSALLNSALTETAQTVEAALDRLLPQGDGLEVRLHQAMRYSCLGGGKRLRPFLLIQSASLFNVALQGAVQAACALEMIHCYSLIHDDLPCMDDDDLRRGRPTCHRQFDQATALLAGDALQSRAFEVMADPDTHSDPAVRCHLVAELAQAAGGFGMAGGQMVDLRAHEAEMDVPAITRLQQMKTGRLISFACEAGAIMGKAAPSLRHALRAYAHDLGLAFQIADDLLDVEGDQAEVGKKLGKDQAAGKATFVSLLGVERAHAQADMLVDQAIRHLDPFDDKADLLRAVAHFVVTRRN